MSSSPMQATDVVQKPSQRKPYHTPRMEDYGAVNELTRSGGLAKYSDASAGYTSTPD